MDHIINNNLYEYLVRLKSTHNPFQFKITSEPIDDVSEDSNKNVEIPCTDLLNESSILIFMFIFYTI